MIRIACIKTQSVDNAMLRAPLMDLGAWLPISTQRHVADSCAISDLRTTTTTTSSIVLVSYMCTSQMPIFAWHLVKPAPIFFYYGTISSPSPEIDDLFRPGQRSASVVCPTSVLSKTISNARYCVLLLASGKSREGNCQNSPVSVTPEAPQIMNPVCYFRCRSQGRYTMAQDYLFSGVGLGCCV